MLVEYSVGFNTSNAWNPSIASMLPQSQCGDEEDGYIGLPSWLHNIYMTSLLKDFLEVAIESWSEWDLNPQPLNSVQML